VDNSKNDSLISSLSPKKNNWWETDTIKSSLFLLMVPRRHFILHLDACDLFLYIFLEVYALGLATFCK